MGIDCELAVGPAFVYRAEDPAGRGVEHEYDILLTGTTGGDPVPDPDEVAAWEWVIWTTCGGTCATGRSGTPRGSTAACRWWPAENAEGRRPRASRDHRPSGAPPG